MYIIKKEFSFSASHLIHGLPDTHPCSRLHGHNYRVEVVLGSDTLDSVGFVRDYRELGAFKDYLDQNLDHRHLNDVLGDENVTAERMAKLFYDWCRSRWPEVCAVRVSETPKTWAEYRAEHE
ncbi:MAG: 6-carboxytetrahydropterin synthase QueD [Micavibrio sp.]|nr:6-carboxytetrahydropterin synthase QueD [Micavibrio sp.]|tara:strand:- start:64 stop:429 length:366 start_codon:yes stop_codon:yes gene_type:complete